MNELDCHLPAISLHRFSKKDTRLYDAYLKLKYEVFVQEQGWHSLAADGATGTAREDEFDARGRFWLASAEELLPVGIVRGIPLKDGFPHEDLLAHHLLRPELAGGSEILATINGLAVHAQWRRARYRVRDCAWVGSIAKLLMLALIRDLETEGMRGAIATAGTPVSCRLCESIGFTAIDPPQRTGLHPDPMINIGMVFGSPQHIRAQKECGMWQGGEPVLGPEAARLLRYFEERRAALSDARPIAAILADA